MEKTVIFHGLLVQQLSAEGATWRTLWKVDAILRKVGVLSVSSSSRKFFLGTWLPLYQFFFGKVLILFIALQNLWTNLDHILKYKIDPAHKKLSKLLICLM